MMEDYNNSLKPETIQNMPNLTIRNEEEQNWSNYLHFKKFRQKGDRHINRPAKMNSNNILRTKNDRHLFSDDTMIKTTGVNELYEKLTKYENVAKKYKININWGKVIIVVKKKMRI